MLFSAAAQASATILEPLSIEQMSARSTRVVVGIVTAVHEDAGTPDTGPRTGIDIAVSDTLKGTDASAVTAYVPGGTAAGGMRMTVDGMPTFVVGEPCAVFVDDNGWVMGGVQGKVIVRGDRVPGEGESVATFSARVRGATKGGAVGLPVAPAQRQVPLLSSAGEPIVTSAAGPVVVSVTPSTAPAGTGASVVISGSGFGISRGSVSFYYQGSTRIPATSILQWTDTEITCVVPVAIIAGYPASAGSGDVLVTTSGGLSSTPASSGAANLDVPFGYGGQKWARNSSAAPHVQVTFRVNPAGVTARQASVQAAAAAWNTAGADFTFVDGGLTSRTAFETSQPDFSNDLMWSSSVAAGVIAEAGGWSDNYGNIIDCDVRFNTAYAWGDGTGATMDVQSVAVHEMGHWLRLRDLYGPADNNKVMYGMGSYGMVKRTLSPGDTAGITWIYSGGGTGGGGGVGQTAVFRFLNRRTGAHFFTADPVERGIMIEMLSKVYRFEGVAYTIDNTVAANNVPLYRFYNKRTGTHLYTASEEEKNNVVSTMSSTYHLDGVAYMVSSYSAGATPIYRFYNVRKGTHFYTADEGEKASVIANLGAIYRYEGPAFYISH